MYRWTQSWTSLIPFQFTKPFPQDPSQVYPCISLFFQKNAFQGNLSQYSSCNILLQYPSYMPNPLYMLLPQQYSMLCKPQRIHYVIPQNVHLLGCQSRFQCNFIMRVCINNRLMLQNIRRGRCWHWSRCWFFYSKLVKVNIPLKTHHSWKRKFLKRPLL